MRSKRAKAPRFSRLELRILEVLWTRGPVAIREVQEAIDGARPTTYTTVQTMVYRLEAKGAVRRVGKIGNAHVFEAVVARQAAHRRLMDEWLAMLGGRTQPVMAHWIETGQLTRQDLEAAEAELRRREEKKP
ncbi:MAG TPA: BlaI/MecI/CopY family transcriptional regulator [Terriglobales bacterium]|jgi:predicted transcriptional regulator